METIIGLLFILLPLLFRFIGKKLEQSGHPDAAGTIRDFAEIFGSEEEEDVQKEENVSPKPRPRMEPVVEVKPRKTSPRKPVLVEEKDVKREKIDPKKLVIYSEIMNPKYNQEY